MQQPALPIDRPNISEAVASAVRDMIVDGRLPAGERLNEVHLASRLGVSRTPLREALGRLAAEEALSSVPRVGYFVRALTSEEFRQIYPMRAILDPEALRLAGLPSAPKLARLESLNRQLLSARDAGKVIALDDAWHLELIGDCPNAVLIGLIEQFMRRTRRYEIALMRERRNVRGATDDHDRILSALRRRDLGAAAEALRQNMQTGIEPVLAWLASREAAEPSHRGASE
ncbi:MAG: GntR family transcriptional regulator [Acidobacteriota bacterium]|nr:GntR family transcriptional regulator [Acidobacteriota bacterium]